MVAGLTSAMGVVMERCLTCDNGHRLPAKLREVDRGPKGEPQYVCADCGRGKAEDSCPYCGGDESKCDYTWQSDRCSQMSQ